MTEIVVFYSQHGVALTAIAIGGIIILGVLKYLDVFQKFDETKRHLMYILISVLLSMLGGAIYLLVTNSFEIKSFVLFAIHIFSLNQMFYNIFKNTTFNDLVEKILNKITNFSKDE